MKAVELSSFSGFKGLRVIDASIPEPGPSEVLIEVRASGINFAEVELTKGKYPSAKQPPFLMGFEASGIVVKTGAQVHNVQSGDRVAALVSTGGYAEYATAAAEACIPIPNGISFAEATTIPVQHSFALAEVAAAFEALSSRQTIGKVVLTP